MPDSRNPAAPEPAAGPGKGDGPAHPDPSLPIPREPDTVLLALRDVNARLDRLLGRSLAVMAATAFGLGYAAGLAFSVALLALRPDEPLTLRSWPFVQNVAFWGAVATVAILAWIIGAGFTVAPRTAVATRDRRVLRLAREAADRCGTFPPDEILITADGGVDLADAVVSGFKRSRRQLIVSGALLSPQAEPCLVLALHFQLAQRAGVGRGVAERAARFRALITARDHESSLEGAPPSAVIAVSLGRIALSLVTIAGTLAIARDRRLGEQRTALAEAFANAITPDGGVARTAQDRLDGFTAYIDRACRPFIVYGMIPAHAARGYDRWRDDEDAAGEPRGSGADDVARTLLLEANDPAGKRIRAVPWSELTHEAFRPIALAQRDAWIARVPRLRKAKTAYRQLDRLLRMLDAGEGAKLAAAIDARIDKLMDDARDEAVRGVIRSVLQHVFVAALLEGGGTFVDPREGGALIVELPARRVNVLEMVEAEAARWGGESALRGVFGQQGGGEPGGGEGQAHV